MSLLKFNVRCSYNGAVYESGSTYEVNDYPLGYVLRWVKRGVAEEVEKADGEILDDPRGVLGSPPVEGAEDYTGLETPASVEADPPAEVEDPPPPDPDPPADDPPADDPPAPKKKARKKKSSSK
jgi:hypothetical protein